MCQGYAFAQVNPPMESTLAYNCSKLLTGVGATHNPEVVGSNPAPATKKPQVIATVDGLFFVKGAERGAERVLK